ncbi:hypothetical protein JW823_00250 [bacterium]|nr:hypothetical protein [candidate division CSSED10-310 bacterium]
MKKLGEILLDQGLLTPDQLEKVLRRQSMSGGRFGEHLVQMMLMDETQVCEMLALQKGIPAAMPSDLENIPDEVIQKLSGELVQSYRVVPFRVMGRRMHVAMLEADDIQLVDELSHKSGYIIRPYVCMESLLHRALAKYYQIAVNPVGRADATVEASMMQDLIVHDNQYSADKEIYETDQSLVALGDSGQFTVFDRTNILGTQTKSLFLEATGNKEAVGYFLQFMEQLCDRVVFLVLDNAKNFFWNDVADFRRGSKGVPLLDKLQKIPFWSEYLQNPEIKYVGFESDSNDMRWVPKMLRMEELQAFVVVPIHISHRLTGIAIGGTRSAFTLMEEVDTLNKLQVMTDCSLTILRCKRTIQEIE